jgi:hypothetical protein
MGRTQVKSTHDNASGVNRRMTQISTWSTCEFDENAGASNPDGAEGLGLVHH